MSGADSGVSHGPETGEKLLTRGDHAVRFFGNGTFTEMDLLGSVTRVARHAPANLSKRRIVYEHSGYSYLLLAKEEN